MRSEFDATPLAARNQGTSDECFEPLHLQGDRRLRAPDSIGRARKALLFGDEHEGAHQIEIQGGGQSHG